MKGKVILERKGSTSVVTYKHLIAVSLRTTRLLRRRKVRMQMISVFAVGPLSRTLILGYTRRAKTVIATRGRSICNKLNTTITRFLNRGGPAIMREVKAESRFKRIKSRTCLEREFKFAPRGVTRHMGRTVTGGGS